MNSSAGSGGARVDGECVNWLSYTREQCEVPYEMKRMP
jgi:hypothetical protein